MTTILHLLQIVGMFFLLKEIPFWLWSTFAVALIILFFLGKSYYNVAEEDGPKAKQFWYQIRSIVFVVDILSVIGMFAYILLA